MVGRFCHELCKNVKKIGYGDIFRSKTYLKVDLLAPPNMQTPQIFVNMHILALV